MSNLTFENLENLEYKYIFDYYDMPLSYIGCVNQKNYLFYYIDVDSYFVSELTEQDTIALSNLKNLTTFMEYLIKEDKVKVLKFDVLNKKIEWLSIDDSLSEKYLPKSNEKIQYDFLSKKEIKEHYNFEENLVFKQE